MNMSSKGGAETFLFQAEIAQLLSLIMNTFYPSKIVFLRELISNASDALDKLRYTALTSNIPLNAREELCIKLLPDRKKRTLTIIDNGIGMTKDELIGNLGTIAKSGTKSFVEALQAGADISMIGQFGVGFFAAFLVAERVCVATKHNDDCQWTWTSKGDGTFMVRADNAELLHRGTRIVLHMKRDDVVLLEEYALRAIVKKHSQFVAYPIKLLVKRWYATEEAPSTSSKSTNTSKSTKTSKSSKSVAVGTDTVSGLQKSYKTLVQLNTIKPVWMRQPAEITHEEYAEFYKSISNDWEDHLAVKHFVVEGQLEFRALLYVPPRAPDSMFRSTMKDDNIKFYLRRVFVTDRSKDLIPRYLRFIKGIVDSEDLPLCVSRCSLQNNKVLCVITKTLVKKSIDMLEELAERPDAYTDFYAQFSRNVKLGVTEDTENRLRLAELLRFYTSASGEERCSLGDYVGRMKTRQHEIYVITGESMRQVRDAPQIERVRAMRYEVIYMIEPMDEYLLLEMIEFRGHMIASLNREGVELYDRNPSAIALHEWQMMRCHSLCKFAERLLQYKVERVIVSTRLVKSPCCVVATHTSWTAQMEKLMRAESLCQTDTMPENFNQRVLELNAEHPIILRMMCMLPHLACRLILCDMLELLYETAMVASGYDLPNPDLYVLHVDRIMKLCLGIERMTEVMRCAGDAPLESNFPDDGDDIIAEEVE